MLNKMEKIFFQFREKSEKWVVQQVHIKVFLKINKEPCNLE